MVFIPTTIISQGDSCIGGKTSINYMGIKNQLGNFYPPKKIILNPNFIKKLPKKEFFSGMGEMGHYFFLSNKIFSLIFTSLCFLILINGNKFFQTQNKNLFLLIIFLY